MNGSDKVLGIYQVVPSVCREKGRMPVPGQKYTKENTEKESRRQDALGTPLEAPMDPFRIASYT